MRWIAALPGRGVIHLAVVSVVALAIACGSGGEGEAVRDDVPPPPTVSAPPRDVAANDSSTWHVRYDLAAHVARAELHHGGALVADLGVPGGAKYTLGRWQTSIGGDRDLDGTTVALIPGETGKLLLPIASREPTAVAIRARAFRDGRLTVYVDDRTVAHATLPTDGTFATVRVDLPPTLEPGEHMLQLRVPATGRTRSGESAGIAVDWMRVGERTDRDVEPPAPAMLATGESLAIPASWSLGYALDIESGLRLRGTVHGDAGARLVVTAHRDGAAPRALGTIAATRDGAPVDIDLGAIGAGIVRVDLAAEGGSVRVASPAIVARGGAVREQPSTRPRNVIVFLIDTLRADKLRPYNEDTRVRTPGLDRWVRRAAVFERGHTQENWTKPSVATLLSSLMPWEHQATSSEAVLPQSVQILPEILGERGYHTGAFIANGYVSDKFGFRQGWSTFRNYIREGRRNQASFVAADVLEWLDARPTDKPFFLYVHTIDPHVPYMPPSEVLATYDPDPYEGPVDFGRDRELLEKIKIGRIRLSQRDKQRLEALYDGEITYHDIHFASVLDGLERRGLADDTIVVVTADHGEELFDHGSVGHGHSVFEELLHVPFLVRVPGVTDGSLRVSDAVGLVDVVPTVLDALGLPLPPDAAGRSLLPLLRGHPETAPRITVSGFMNGWRAIVVGRHKLVQRTAAHVMLYDLGADPREQRDIAASHPLTVRYMRGLLGLALSGEARQRATEHRAERTEIDAQTEAELRALGYVGTSRP